MYSRICIPPHQWRPPTNTAISSWSQPEKLELVEVSTSNWFDLDHASAVWFKAGPGSKVASESAGWFCLALVAARQRRGAQHEGAAVAGASLLASGWLLNTTDWRPPEYQHCQVGFPLKKQHYEMVSNRFSKTFLENNEVQLSFLFIRSAKKRSLQTNSY